MDEYDVLRHIKGYQHRVDDQREMMAPMVAALMNNERGRKDKKVKPTDIFDREKKERHQAGSSVANRSKPRGEQKLRPDHAKKMPMPQGLRDMLNANKEERG